MPQTSRSIQPRAVPPSESHQIATSNETLNLLLGGRNHSWMTTGSSTDFAPRQEPRPSQIKPRKRGRPTAEPATEPVTTAPLPTPNETAPQHENISIGHVVDQPTASVETIRASTVLPSPALTDAPSPNVANQHDCANTLPTAHPEGTASRHPLPNGVDRDGAVPFSNIAPALQEQTSNSTPPHPPPTEPPSRNMTVDSTPSVSVNQAGALPIPFPVSAQVPAALVNQAAVLPASLPANAQIDVVAPSELRARTNRPNSDVHLHRAKRARVQGPATPNELRNQALSMQWKETITSRVKGCDSAGLLNDNVEKPRYRILIEACANTDHFYIALHQILCAWSLDKAPVHKIFQGLVDPSQVDGSFETLQTVLRNNQAMSVSHLEWFANFPVPLAEVLRVFHPSSLAKDIGTFLIQLSLNWYNLIQSVGSRMHPLLACELIEVLRCPSQGLQAMFFTMSRRWLGIKDGPVANAINDIFEKDRTNEAAAADRGDTPEKISKARSQIIAQYSSLVVQEHQRHQIQMQHQQLRQQQQLPANAMLSPTITHTAPIAERRGQRSVPQSPVVPSHTVVSSPALAQSPSVPQFDALAPRPSISDRRVSSPAITNQHPPPGSPALQEHRRSGPNYVPADPRIAPPPSTTNYYSPRIQPPSLPGAASAGPSPSHSRNGSQSTPQTPILPSQGQLQAPVLLSNGPSVHPQRRAASIAYPSQSVPNAQGGYLQHPPTIQPHYIEQAPQSGPRQVMNPAPMAHPHTQMMHPHQAVQPLPHMQHAVLTPTSPNYPHPVQALIPQHQAYQTPGVHRPVPPRRAFAPIPETEYPMSPYGRVSLQVGLHKVGLRSPRRVPAQPANTRYYQYIKQFALQPMLIAPQTGLRIFNFNVPKDHMRRLARKTQGEGLPYCYYSEGSCRYRLRTCARSAKETAIQEADWVLAAAQWPPYVFFDLNRTCMELRRKQHFHKDQPMELTDFLVEGENSLRLSFPQNPQNQRLSVKYFLAVEIVETISHDSAMKMIETGRRIPIEDTKRKIQGRLRGSDSDDVIIEDETLSVSLADPFSATRFNIPVRGAHCQHLECFDLETWLQTRPQKPAQQGGGASQVGDEPSLVDVWKCPICGQDARPSSLWVDDYLVSVRQALVANGDTRTKAITIDATGAWYAVEEPDDSDDDESPGPRPLTVAQRDTRQSESTMPARATVIEILDDD
ncbi:SP-RING-type domain-containing protein [Fusarium falciforme]|uniref:SP-RING-type domain-containing protein n=1 Tax=Fusarium falciforme TaxID=195108 RepID=UPI002300A316|nr:SP-RING-type domain-containing protein [Fusarium falciforme]WAO89396.1 SP-RING-type domain-containing protein [Fusarium falciforme]